MIPHISQFCLLFHVLYFVRTSTHAFERDFAQVAVLQPKLGLSTHPYTFGAFVNVSATFSPPDHKINLRPRKYQVAWEQGRALTQHGDDLGDAQYHVLRAIVLHDLAIHSRRYPQVLRIFDQLWADDTGADRSPAVESLPKTPLAAPALQLPLTMADVVADAEAGDVVERTGLGYVAGLLTYDDHELAFVVEAFEVLAQRWHGYGVERPSDGSDRLEEEHGIGRNRQPRLVGMLCVIQPQTADGPNVFGSDWGEEASDVLWGGQTAAEVSVSRQFARKNYSCVS